MQAIGNDGKWHPWEELTPEEQQKWNEGQREADEIWERMKNGELQRPKSLEQHLLDYENNHRLC